MNCFNCLQKIKAQNMSTLIDTFTTPLCTYICTMLMSIQALNFQHIILVRNKHRDIVVPL